MKPPKCKSCGAEEWRHTCGTKEGFGGEVARKSVKTPKSPKAVRTPAVAGTVVDRAENVAGARPAARKPFDRVEYQRDYMREWRKTHPRKKAKPCSK